MKKKTNQKTPDITNMFKHTQDAVITKQGEEIKRLKESNLKRIAFNSKLLIKNAELRKQIPDISKTIYMQTQIDNAHKRLEKSEEENASLKKEVKILEELYREQRNNLNALAYLILKQQSSPL